jgi:hypothetical protein
LIAAFVPAASAAIALAAQATAASFAPPLDTPIRVVAEAVRTDSGVTRRFVSAKRVVFRRDGAGFRAEVTVEPSAPSGSDDDPAAMFIAGMARLAGRTLVFQLDAQGRVTGMTDQAAAWQAMLDGLAALSPPGEAADRVRAARARAVVDMFAQLPPERQRAMLASMLVPLIAADIAAEGAGPPRAVRVPAASAFGTAQLDGLRAVRDDRGLLEVSVSATGPVSVKGPAGVAAGTMTLETLRRVDPRTGLLISSEEAVRTVLPDGSLASERVTVTRVAR